MQLGFVSLTHLNIALSIKQNVFQLQVSMNNAILEGVEEKGELVSGLRKGGLITAGRLPQFTDTTCI